MSKNKKKKKVQKQGNSQVAQDIGLGLKTLISNDACIKAAREWRGLKDIIPVVVALGAVVLALVPYFVQQNSVQGSSVVLANPTGSYELGLAELVHSIAYDENNNVRPEPITLGVSQDGKLQFENKTTDFFNYPAGNPRWYTVSRMEEDSEGKLVDKIAFEVFINTDPTNLTDTTFFTRIDKGEDPFTGIPFEADKESYRASYIAFGQESVRFRRRNQTVTANGLTGTYSEIKGRSITDFAKSEKLADVKDIDQAYIDEVATYFVDFINKSFEPSKQAGLWMYTGIFFGVDAGAIILFGLMLFLMTRGKKNPFRIYTLWETQKMAYWSALAPAILSLFGFAIPSMAFILFFFIFGFRMMWMSMKSMRPAV